MQFSGCDFVVVILDFGVISSRNYKCQWYQNEPHNKSEEVRLSAKIATVWRIETALVFIVFASHQCWGSVVVA